MLFHPLSPFLGQASQIIAAGADSSSLCRWVWPENTACVTSLGNWKGFQSDLISGKVKGANPTLIKKRCPFVDAYVQPKSRTNCKEWSNRGPLNFNKGICYNLYLSWYHDTFKGKGISDESMLMRLMVIWQPNSWLSDGGRSRANLSLWIAQPCIPYHTNCGLNYPVFSSWMINIMLIVAFTGLYVLVQILFQLMTFLQSISVGTHCMQHSVLTCKVKPLGHHPGQIRVGLCVTAFSPWYQHLVLSHSLIITREGLNLTQLT